MTPDDADARDGGADVAHYELKPERANIHGHFSPDLPPVLTLDSGDSVTYEIPDARWQVPVGAGAGATLVPVTDQRTSPDDDGHCLLGPVYVRGAEPGMTLAVGIEEVVPGPLGWTFAGGWQHPVNEWLGLVGERTRHDWRLDDRREVATNQFGHTVALRPFCGVMGLPPGEPGKHSTAPPRVTGGNLDCKELVAGTTLYLPVAVSGALFSVGDGHAVQGDGEASVTAIECPMERVRLTFTLLPDVRVATPRARTADAWLTLGVDEDLGRAALRALDEMVALMTELHALSRADALALASLVVDLRVTQIVNGVQGVHAVLRDGSLRVRS
jgi:acetamidase/formamidase